MGLDLTSFDAALKDHYTNQRVENMVYSDNPLLALMPKEENFGGRGWVVPQIYGNPQGRSADFQRAQARGKATSTLIDDFYVRRAKDYSVATIDNETLEASQGDANAFMTAATTEIDGAINSLTRSLAIAMYGSGFGKIGTIGSFSTTTITLEDPDDVTNFEVGQELVVAQSESGHALRALGSSGNGLIITKINRGTGVLTFGDDVDDSTNGIPTIANGDAIFVRGDRQDSSTPTAKKVTGLEAWNPFTTPSNSLFWGVDRTVDVTRLAGLRLDGTNLPIEEVLYEGAAMVAREGFGIDHYFMGYNTYTALEKSLGSKVQYVDLKATAEIGFRAIQINGPRGPVKCIADQNCPSNRVRGLKLSMWTLKSLGKAVRVIDTDGLQMLRQSDADGVEVRYGYYANIGCKAVGTSIAIKV